MPKQKYGSWNPLVLNINKKLGGDIESVSFAILYEALEDGKEPDLIFLVELVIQYM